MDFIVKYLVLVGNWCFKWFGKGEIFFEIVKWVLNKELKLGVVFGNIKIYKIGNLFRFIIFCCGMVIENLLVFIEFYL